jgi:hypothetical protein
MNVVVDVHLGRAQFDSHFAVSLHKSCAPVQVSDFQEVVGLRRCTNC